MQRPQTTPRERSKRIRQLHAMFGQAQQLLVRQRAFQRELVEATSLGQKTIRRPANLHVWHFALASVLISPLALAGETEARQSCEALAASFNQIHSPWGYLYFCGNEYPRIPCYWLYERNSSGGVLPISAAACWVETPAPPPPPPPPPKVVAIDPGHGFNCPAEGLPLGAVGVTDFPANNPPPGRLREDELTMAIAREVERILPKSKYRVVLTKTNVNECPDYKERGRIANEEKAKAFVSIHINKALLVLMTNSPVPYGIAHGTSVLYRLEKPESISLAESMARNVSSSLGVNNRGVKVDELWVLSPEVTKTKIAVLLESARLSGEDEKKLHTSGSTTRIAEGIRAALDESLGN